MAFDQSAYNELLTMWQRIGREQDGLQEDEQKAVDMANERHELIYNEERMAKFAQITNTTD